MTASEHLHPRFDDEPRSESPTLPLLADVDWRRVFDDVDEHGCARTPALLGPGACDELVAMFDRDEHFRSTVVMARHSFGEGTYRYFADPLPDPVAALREALYPPLRRLANRWAVRLGERQWPGELSELTGECAERGQHRPTPLLLRYAPGGYNCLHQDVYGDLTFPLQVAIMLSTPDIDFTGGENVFVENRPRLQSRPVVVRPGLGEGLVFPVHHRPVRGARGDRRVTMRHGVSVVHTGQRHVLGIIFHNAP